MSVRIKDNDNLNSNKRGATTARSLKLQEITEEGIAVLIDSDIHTHTNTRTWSINEKIK